jgi:hypothetical protein
LEEFRKLPAKRKPTVRDNGLREWVPLSGIVVKGEYIGGIMGNVVSDADLRLEIRSEHFEMCGAGVSWLALHVTTIPLPVSSIDNSQDWHEMPPSLQAPTSQWRRPS